MIRFLTDVDVNGAITIIDNKSEFPENPRIGTIIIKDQILYAYLTIDEMETWYPFASRTRSYIHTQGEASSTWTVTHNLGTSDVWYQIRDEEGRITYAQTATVDSDSFTVSFTTPITGSVVVVAPDDIEVPNIKANNLSVAGDSVIIDNSGIRVDGSYVLTAANGATRIKGGTLGTFTNGDVSLLAGSNVTITQVGANITIASTGGGEGGGGGTSTRLTTDSVNFIDGDILLSAGSNVTLTQSGSTITIASTGQEVSLSGAGGTSISGTYPNFTITSTDNNTVTRLKGGTAGTFVSGDVNLLAGTSVSITQSGNDITVTNSAPDQIVSLTGAGGTSISGTYPNFTITSTSTDTTVVTRIKGGTAGTLVSGDVNLLAGTSVSITQSGNDITVTNSAPDQVVSLTGAGSTSISGTYPNFTITSTDNNTVTRLKGGAAGTLVSGDVNLLAGTSVSITQSGNDITVTNSAPDQVVSLTGAGGTSISGTYPNFTITSTDNNTVTRIKGGAAGTLVSGDVNLLASGGVSITQSGNDITVGSTGLVTLTGAQTVTDKTFKDCFEAVFTVTDATTVNFDPVNGSVQLWTLTASRTATFTGLDNGQSMMLVITAGANSISWSGVIWKTEAGLSPTLNSSGTTIVMIWNAGGAVYGARVGDA